MQILTKTLKDAGFDGIFTEVVHTETLGLKNPNQSRMFHLDVENNMFSFDTLHGFLMKNIGRYVFSRSRVERFVADDELEAIGAKAIGLLRKTSDLDESWLGDQLGDILLYVFLEQILEAPKVLNKVELLNASNSSINNAGGIHLLPLTGATQSCQMIFGKSHIVGDIQDAIDNTFVQIDAVKNNMTNEIQLLASTVLSQSFNNETAEYLKEIIIPSKVKSVLPDKAFGVFVGYSLGLNPDNYSNKEFRIQLKQKMDTDIKAHIPYISQKIRDLNMNAYSFYFYFLPFNDADEEKKSIMKVLLDGGV